VIGPSGAGKSTFLRCLNLLEKPTSGEVKFDGTDLTNVDEKQLINLRERMGMVFQSFNLFPNMTVIENLKLAPIRVKHMKDDESSKSCHAFIGQSWPQRKSQCLSKQLVRWSTTTGGHCQSLGK